MNEPKIRFKGFEGEWEEKKLGDILLVNSGKDYKHLKDGNIPVYGTGGYMLSVNESLSSVDAIGIGRKGTIDKPQYLKAPFWTVDTLFFLTTKENDDLSFLYSMAQTIGWKDLDESTGVPSLSKSNINEIDISVPSLPEQRLIASYFTHLDTLIESSRQRVEKLKQVKAASLQAMFPQNGNNVPKIRFKGCEGEWKKVKVEEIGYTFNGLSGKDKNDFGKGQARYITFLNVLNNAHIDTSILERFVLKRYEKQNEVKKGDLFFNTSSETPEEVGMCAVLDEDVKGVYLNSFCFGFRVTDENVCSAFIAYMMRSHVGRGVMAILAQGATRFNLSKASFCKAEIMLPSLPEQRKIVQYFTHLDTLLTLAHQRYAKLQQVKRASLTQMFV